MTKGLTSPEVDNEAIDGGLSLPAVLKPSGVRHLLASTAIDHAQLLALTFQGLDADSAVRPIVWRVLLGLLGPSPAAWTRDLQQKRSGYDALQRQFPFEGLRRRHELPKDDETLLHDIEKDVARTHVHMPFFSLSGVASEWMTRILFLFAKSHAEIGYCQGMHEIVAPLLYVFGTDSLPDWSSHAEADAFAAFETLMQLLAPLHLASKTDPKKTGVQVQMARLHMLLRQHDAALWLQLNSLAVLPEYYSFRWYITLLSHEFAMDATLRLWDALLADSKRFAFLHYVSCALIISHRDALLHRNADFGVCLTILQSKPKISIEALLQKAHALREVDRDADIKTRTRHHPPPPPPRSASTT
ncbi:Aste57867_13484 [Aphanomyces stellatus]|uniref:Aste57867_13484 protein n=1 Tax=Aphanomyces stellatus TaxID=120398 RepID=A0A485KY89_9STRA|nr:hypothetical protein As57867_013434 [Aphanomyces stellatus]VFT90322.1 Aste57867_13484 [Aphanomyces stellatus]